MFNCAQGEGFGLKRFWHSLGVDPALLDAGEFSYGGHFAATRAALRSVPQVLLQRMLLSTTAGTPTGDSGASAYYLEFTLEQLVRMHMKHPAAHNSTSATLACAT